MNLRHKIILIGAGLFLVSYFFSGSFIGLFVGLPLSLISVIIIIVGAIFPGSTVRCPNCHHGNPRGSVFCNKCGNRLNGGS